MKQCSLLLLIMFSFIQLDCVRHKNSARKLGQKKKWAKKEAKRTSPITIERDYDNARMSYRPSKGTFKGVDGRVKLHLCTDRPEQPEPTEGLPADSDSPSRSNGASPVCCVSFDAFLRRQTAFQMDFNRWTRQVYVEEGHDPLALFSQGHELKDRSSEFPGLDMAHRIATGIKSSWQYVEEDEKYTDVAPVMAALLDAVVGEFEEE